LIANGDRAFKAGQYEEAKSDYVEASALFPKEEYPITKIEEINLIHKADVQNRQQAYDKAIADADKFFASNNLDQALGSYRIAKAYKPDESYPVQMIDKILAILERNAIRDLVTSSIIIESNDLKKFPFAPVSVADRKKNLIYIKAANNTDKEFKVVMSYGKGGSKNGGYIIPITTGEDKMEYIIPIGKQYTWFSEDNDWISLAPQGGSVQVNLIKISKGN
jgi:tetratricopeptide (TPR) repeat protein